jgi:hypothetical protein
MVPAVVSADRVKKSLRFIRLVFLGTSAR